MTDNKWGDDVTWGGCLWGGYDAPLAGEQGYEAHAKPDTVFLSQAPAGANADLINDLSQIDTDLTAQGGATYGDEAPSSRTALTYPRTLTVQVVMDTTGAVDSGTLLDHSGAAGGQETFRLLIEAVGDPSIEIYQDDGKITALDLPTNGTTDKLTIMWSTEWNPLTTGAADLCRSELWVYNHHSNVWASTTKTHATPTTNTGWDFTLKSNRGGGDTFSGDIVFARVDEAFHSSAELSRELVEPIAPPTLTADTRREGLVPTSASGFGDDGAFMCQHAVVASAVREMDLRLVGPLVNEVYFEAEEMVQNFVPDEWYKYPPGVTVAERGAQPFKFMLPFLRYVPVSDAANRIYNRVQVQNYTTGTIRKLDVRCYTMSRRPIIGGFVGPGNAPDPMEYWFTADDTSTDHTSTGIGEWLNLGLSKIARDQEGGTWLCLAAEIHSGTIDADARYKIKAWTCDMARLDGDDTLPGPLVIGNP